MFEAFTTTQTLATFIGIYFLAAGTGILLAREDMPEMFEEINNQPMLGYLGGIIAFVVGSVIISIHNDWSSLLAGFVSLIGWIALTEGVAILAFRKWFLGLFSRLALSSSLVTFWATGTLLAGVAMLLAVAGG